ncbi:hypothetical protein QQX09_13690 [Demequina sp. SYSU T00192]|uniref:DUF4190 domain-containing protein n=1 Tax=Demequina litoralis TaxID=3051660 RepID=A0ABT8GCN5_9MICO|nr:hypothetical protein [Demequina sp. SYSU T00192]MDN4476906.1 hypothetical protein [Demequina sp. SYSU T00192]
MTPAPPEYLGYVGHPELPHGYYPYLGPLPGTRKDWLADASVAAGVALLFPAAIVLGHLALRAVRSGDSRSARRARLGLALGYGVAAAANLAYLVLAARHAMAGGTPST